MIATFLFIGCNFETLSNCKINIIPASKNMIENTLSSKLYVIEVFVNTSSSLYQSIRTQMECSSFKYTHFSLCENLL